MSRKPIETCKDYIAYCEREDRYMGVVGNDLYCALLEVARQLADDRLKEPRKRAALLKVVKEAIDCVPEEVPMSAWISVKERLPEPVDTVLVWTHDDCYIGWFDPAGEFRDENGAISDVTHWQPLPLPPEPDR